MWLKYMFLKYMVSDIYYNGFEDQIWKFGGNLAVGFILGFLIGYALKKFLKIVAVFLGLLLLLLLFLSYKGLIIFNTEAFYNVFKDFLGWFQVEGSSFINFILTQFSFAVGFTGGFFIGFKKG